MAEAYPTLLAGQRITASMLSSMLPQTARKTADTGRAATTVTVADPHLQFEVVANAVYVWWGWLKFDGPTAGDITIDFTAPSGALGEWMGHGPGIGRVVGTTDATPPVFTVDTSATTGYLQRMETNDVAAARGFGTVTGIQFTMDLKGTLRVGSTGGTFSLDWAQRISDASTTSLYTDSWITMIRIA